VLALARARRASIERSSKRQNTHTHVTHPDNAYTHTHTSSWTCGDVPRRRLLPSPNLLLSYFAISFRSSLLRSRHPGSPQPTHTTTNYATMPICQNMPLHLAPSITRAPPSPSYLSPLAPIRQTSCPSSRSIGSRSHHVSPLNRTGVGSSHSSDRGRPNVSERFCRDDLRRGKRAWDVGCGWEMGESGKEGCRGWGRAASVRRARISPARGSH
jgi:hypothetical protein